MKKHVVYAASLLVALATAFAADVSAQSLPDFKQAVRPVGGVFSGPSVSGTAWTVDWARVGANDLFFGTYYHYNPDGSATWLNMQSNITQASIAEYTATGVAAYVRGSLYRGQGGTCFECPSAAPTLVYPPIGDRQINVYSSKRLRVPSGTGGATVEALHGPSVVAAAGKTLSTALLENRAIWAVSTRFYSNGIERLFNAGWMRFKKRTGTKATMTGFEPAGVAPAFLAVADFNAPDQHELECISTGLSAEQLASIGGCSAAQLLDYEIEGSDTNHVTFLVDPVTDRIRYYKRCVTGATGACNLLQATYIMEAADVIDIGPGADGLSRLVARRYWMQAGGWSEETTFTRVSDAQLRMVFPNGVPQ